MTVLTRYLFRSHVGPLLFAFVALTGVMLINTLARSMADLAGKGLPARVFLEFFIFALPASVALTLPMSVLVAVLYTFSRMAAENEITALRASGIDLRRTVLPLLLAATVIAGGMAWFNNVVLPASNHRLRSLLIDVAQASPLLALRPQVINTIDTGDGSSRYYLQAGSIVQASNRMYEVTIHDASDPQVSRIIQADSAFMQMTADGTDMMLTLYDGTMREVVIANPESFRRVAFEAQVLRMPGIRQTLERTEGTGFRTDRDMTGPMMRARIDTLRTELAALDANRAAAPPPSAGVPAEIVLHGERIPFAEARAANIRFQLRELEVEIQKKYSIAAATLVFVLLGVPLALRFSGGGIGMVMTCSLSIFAIYYVGLIGGESLADEGFIPPWIAMWVTNTLFGALGALGLWRIGREASSGRDLGWGALPRWLRAPFDRHSSTAAGS